MDRRIDERVVAAIWERSAFDVESLAHLGLQVVFRGLPSDAGGPDYQDAILSSSGRHLITGDIEFHVASEDWYRHGHHRNNRYNNVVLHLVWTKDPRPTVRADGLAVPTLALASDRRACQLASSSWLAPALIVHPCVGGLSDLTNAALRQRVRRAGTIRFLERADLLAADLEVLPADQALYRALSEGLGYASNREGFRALADSVPLAWLLSIPTWSWRDTLLEAAALGPPATFPPPVHLDGRVWRTARLRPANHPSRRIVGLSALLGRLGSSPAARLRDAVTTAKKPDDVRRLLQVSVAGETFIGRGRADELAVSVVLPFVASWEECRETALALFEQYPAPPKNRWTRVMLDLLSEAGHDYSPKLAIDHQGLHFMYHRYCRFQRATECLVCGPPGIAAARRP